MPLFIAWLATGLGFALIGVIGSVVITAEWAVGSDETLLATPRELVF
ncbi:MAG: hypothetical protein AAGJ40_21695 [Planctomycetota bacterium]